MKLFCLNLSFVFGLEEFIYSSSSELQDVQSILSRPEIKGVQLVYNWKSLEKEENVYDFSQIKEDLNYLNGVNKKLFIQVQDRFFSLQARNVPRYLLEDPIYKGGLAKQSDADSEGGWVAKQWIKPVRVRYQKLFKNLAGEFDGKIYGINLPETSIEIGDNVKDFSCDSYFNAELENLRYAKEVFKRSHVVQYVNFWPCGWENENNYMNNTFVFAEKNNIGLGGPDTIPYREVHMKNSYPFFHQSKGKVFPIAMAVQEPDLKYNKTKQEFYDFAKCYLNADVLFWTKCIFDSSYPDCV